MARSYAITDVEVGVQRVEILKRVLADLQRELDALPVVRRERQGTDAERAVDARRLALRFLVAEFRRRVGG